MNCTMTATGPVRWAGSGNAISDWVRRWSERAAFSRERRRRLRAAEILLRRAEERVGGDSSYATDLEAAAFETLESVGALGQCG